MNTSLDVWLEFGTDVVRWIQSSWSSRGWNRLHIASWDREFRLITDLTTESDTANLVSHLLYCDCLQIDCLSWLWLWCAWSCRFMQRKVKPARRRQAHMCMLIQARKEDYIIKLPTKGEIEAEHLYWVQSLCTIACSTYRALSCSTLTAVNGAWTWEKGREKSMRVHQRTMTSQT